jgi:dipeptidyl aminopeptidase/acylaminoacyl peptidase
MSRWFWFAILALASMRTVAAPHTVEELIRLEQHDIIVISPSGKYVAATVRKPINGKNRMLLAIIDRQTNKPVRVIDPEEEGEIAQVEWMSDERIVIRRAFADGALQRYYTDALLVAVNIDGTQKRTFYASIIDTLPSDDARMLIEVCAIPTKDGCRSHVARIDNDFRRNSIERLMDGPDVGVDYVTDAAGNVRFAHKEDDDHVQTVWRWDGAAWQPFYDSKGDGAKLSFAGSTRDGAAAFLWRERPDGPDAIERYEFATGERKVVMHDPEFDPSYLIWSADGRQPIGVAYGPGVPQLRFWDPNDPDAKLLRAIQAQFPKDAVWFHSGSRDGRRIIVGVDSDRDPGSYYLFDRDSKRMDLVARRKPWLNPENLAAAEPIAFDTRDGLRLHGYLTLPPGVASPPLVVMPHGGPFGVADTWEFDTETQLLASHGYSVLRVNYRGSGGRGFAFERAGYRQWGLKIMDDIVDGTRWAAASGRVDPKRICIWGTSFGGYASMMAPLRAPGLYRCAISTAGATNLLITRKWGDTHQSRWGRRYLDEAVGDDEAVLYEQSPIKHVAKIDTPLLLIHGEHDPRVAFEHARAMVVAMEKAGKSMETYFFVDETHGIRGQENQQEYYDRVLAFLKQHLASESSQR